MVVTLSTLPWVCGVIGGISLPLTLVWWRVCSPGLMPLKEEHDGIYCLSSNVMLGC